MSESLPVKALFPNTSRLAAHFIPIFLSHIWPLSRHPSLAHPRSPLLSFINVHGTSPMITAFVAGERRPAFQNSIEEYTQLQETHAASGEGSSGGSVEYSEYHIWSQAIGGMQYGRVYDLGSQAQAYEGMTSSTTSSFAASSHESLHSQKIIALQEELEQVEVWEMVAGGTGGVRHTSFESKPYPDYAAAVGLCSGQNRERCWNRSSFIFHELFIHIVNIVTTSTVKVVEGAIGIEDKESPILNLDYVDQVDCDASSPLDGLVFVGPIEKADATIGLDTQHLTFLGTIVDNNIEFPSSTAPISLVANDYSDGYLGITLNVPVVDVSITLISSEELNNQLISKFNLSHLDHLD
ncbi:hypothetical protein MA16_Dca018309 [Dendrobium catenatum]|uniref:Uncharacterized protein n=1 Tax=Dendrobium catenatum TaxID=906689 RepID=A0A2I0WJH7_9ASPA|nr:hypothetical protein MA16_Dca018309 [Dendrobium catenatum]